MSSRALGSVRGPDLRVDQEILIDLYLAAIGAN